MKNNFKVISAGLAGLMIGCVTVVGANQAIQALQNTEIKVSLNGQVQEFKDETTGERQYPLTYNNRTYLPLRNVAQLAGLSVDYDAKSNTALLKNSNDISSTNSLSKEEMEKELILCVYGGTGEGPFEKVPDYMYLANYPTKSFVVDIDNNGIPEIVKFGNVLDGEEPIQVYTMINDEVILTGHKSHMISNIFAIYETENGVYAYWNNSDGPESDKIVVKLELNGTYLSCKDVLRHLIVESEDNPGIVAKEEFYVDGKIVDKSTYDKKIEELNKIKLIEKNYYRTVDTVKVIDYENLWN